MTKPKQPLQAMRRGFKAMSDSSPLRGIRSLSPAARKGHVELEDTTKHKSGRHGRTSSGNQNFKPVPIIKDEVIGRISPEKMRKEKQQKQQQQQQRQDQTHSHRRGYDSRDEQREYAGSSRGRADRSIPREQPSPPGRRKGGWDPKLEMPRGTVMDHLGEFPLEPPPPPPPMAGNPRTKKSSSPRKKSSSSKKESRRQSSSSPGRRQSLQDQFEVEKGKPKSQHRIQQLTIEPSATSGSRSTFSRSQLIENPQFASSGSSSFLDHHQKHPPPPPPVTTTPRSSPRSPKSSPWDSRPTSKGRKHRNEPTTLVVQNATLTSSSEAGWPVRGDPWGATLESSQSIDSFTAANEWVASFDAAEDKDLWKFDSRVNSKNKRSPRRQRQIQIASEPSESFLSESRDQDVLDSRHEKLSSSFTNSSNGLRVPPPSADGLKSALKSGKDDREKKSRGNGFLNFFGGAGDEQEEKNKAGKNANTGKANLASEMLEIGSDATVTAGDLMVEESFGSTLLSMQQSDSRTFLHDDHGASRFRAPPSMPKSPRKHDAKDANARSRSPPKARNLSGDYLHNKLMHLDSSSYLAREDTDDHSLVSNLTEPTVFKSSQGTESRQPPQVNPSPKQSLSAHSTMESKRASIGRTPTASHSDRMSGPESSWDMSATPNVNTALGRALDMQFLSQTPTTAPDVISPTTHRPPLLPKSTMGSATDVSAAQEQREYSSSLPSRRGKGRSRTPSPSPVQKSTPVPATQGSRNSSPGARLSSKETTNTQPLRKVSPFRRRMESSSKPGAVGDWSKQKDSLIEERLAQSKVKAAPDRPLAKTSSTSTAASRGVALRKNPRAASSSPARKQANVSESPRATSIMARARAQSASRAQPITRQEATRPHQAARRDPSPSPKTTLLGRAQSTGKTTQQKMESLSQVMSRVPSSLGSRGGANDSIELRRKESEKSLHGAKLTVPSVPSREVDSIEQRRRSSASGLRQASPARNATASLQKQAPIQSLANRSAEVSQKHEQVSSYQSASHLNKRRSKTREHPNVEPTTTRMAYVPTNAYSGRFTPKIKKSNDKVTEIRASREQDHDISSTHSSVNPRSPRRKQVPRDVGAQKLRNMIKLRNHFDSSESNSSPGFVNATSASLQKTRQSTKNIRAIENATNTKGRKPSVSTKGRNVSGPISNRKATPPSRTARNQSRPNDRMTMIRETGLIDSFSVAGSDLRSLRSAIQSRTSYSSDRLALSHRGVNLDRYDETKINDPMQRAGLRLLSAAVVPIQAAARRFLARREALSMLWAALVIQARVRAFLEQTRYEIKVYSAIRIQATARGMLVRDRLMFEDYCATEIQRYVRGRIAMVRVYDTIYKISLVQSQVRMRLAIRNATIRMYCALKIQGAARGFLVRCRLAYAHKKATDIQRFVRGYLAAMRVFDEVYKITLVQNCVRRKQALDRATMRMALILSIQALARGYLVRCRLNLAHYHATTIQRYTRGYLGTMRVYEEIYKIMLIQNFFRMKIAVNLATKRMTMIIQLQANWRRYCVLRRMEYAHYNATVIQRYTRGYLATLSVYEEIYKITLIQNFVRMKNAMALASRRRSLIVRVQAIVRGFILRGRLEKICEKAITIQTAWRTFYYRLVYQFKLLDIIILQNVWRRKKAIRVANEKRHALQNLAATIIQTRWRCYDARETYLQYKIEDRAAIIIQTQWRCYDTSMDYLHYLADVLIVQSMARRWFAMREVTAILVQKSIVLQRVARGYLGRIEAKKQRSAVAIQKTWRGFVAFADYMFKIADIVIVQTVARRWFACRRANYLRHKIEHDSATVIQRWRRGILDRRVQAAITIQKVWRGLVQEADFAITLYEYRAARTIQTYWRRFWKFSNYLICLDCSIRIQAVVRGFLARCRYADEQWGAVILQAAARGIIGRRVLKSKKILIGQKLNSNAIGSLESMAATVIQSSIRGYFGRGAHMRYRAAQKIQAMVRGYQGRTTGQRHAAARVIQAMWRCILAQEFYIQSVSAIRIQKHWRGMIYHAAYQRFLAARRIQNCWRISQAKEVVLCRRAERVAAVAIQSAWRGYFYYTNYLFCLCDVAKVQCAIRCYLARKKLKQLRIQRANTAAVAIQKAWRGFYSYTCFLITLSEIIRIQCLARKFLERRRFMGFHATTIQSAWRCYSCYVNYTYTLADIIRIQCQMRRVLAKRRLDDIRHEKEHASAILIQKAWKRYFCRSNYLFILSDVIKVQTEVRRFLAQKLFFDMWEQHAIKSAVKIQTRWRCYFACTNYMFVREDAIKIQAIARGFLARNKFLELFGEKCQASAISIQTTWRRSKAQKNYREILFKVCLIQQRIRYFFAMRELREEAAIFIQKAFRSFVYRSSYISVRSDVIMVQSICRRAVAIKQYRELCYERAQTAAVRIQALVRRSKKRGIFVKTRKAILDIQRYWRGYNDRIGLFVAWKQHIYRIHHAALQFQKLWRGYVVNQRYLYILGSAIEIQSLGRMILAKAYVRRQHEAATKIQALRRKVSARHLALLLCSQRNYVYSRQHGAFMTRSVMKIQRAWRHLIRRRLELKSAKIIRWFSKIAIAKAEIRRRAASKKIYSFFLFARSKQNTPERILHQRKLQSACKIQAWYPAAVRRREQRRKKAARTILRFFKMVKAEVDREIELELKRRKQRKEQRKRHHIKDDKILEIAWEKTSRVGVDQPRRRRADGEKVIQDTLNELQNRSRCTAYAGGSPRHKFQKGAPPMLALADALEDQSVAQCSIASNPFNRPSPSRVESFSQKEIDEDYCLEEAFLDAEINTAKSRRKTEKRKVKSSSSRRNKVSSSASVTSRASVSSRVSVGSRMSVSSRFSTGTKESRDTKVSRSDTETKKVNRHLYKRLEDNSPRQSNRKR